MKLDILERKDNTCVKLPIQGMKSPTKLKIEYKVDRAGFYCEEDINSTNMAHDKSFDLTIYQSQKHLLPDDQKHEYKYTNKPKIIKFYAMDISIMKWPCETMTKFVNYLAN